MDSDAVFYKGSLDSIVSNKKTADHLKHISRSFKRKARWITIGSERGELNVIFLTASYTCMTRKGTPNHPKLALLN